MRLVTDTRTLGLSREEVVLAYERVSATVKEDYTESIRGSFKGALLSSRVFDFETADGELLQGGVHDELEEERLVTFDRDFLNQSVTGVFQVVTVKRLRGEERRSYTLLDVRR